MATRAYIVANAIAQCSATMHGAECMDVPRSTACIASRMRLSTLQSACQRHGLEHIPVHEAEADLQVPFLLLWHHQQPLRSHSFQPARADLPPTPA